MVHQTAVGRTDGDSTLYKPLGRRRQHQMTTPTLACEAILRGLWQWPIDEQVALADAVLGECLSGTSGGPR
jgi:hypothetical protein